MERYEQVVKAELESWQHKMLRQPSLVNKLSKKLQDKINNLIPEKIHKGITIAIKQMVRGVLFGAKVTTTQHAPHQSIEVSEARVNERIDFYKKTAAAEGGVTGAGGFLLALADFPLLLALKVKLLYEIASLYGFDINDYKERVYLLHIFQLAFSSQKKTREIYLQLQDWDEKKQQLPTDINEYDWRSFQQEYRDYIDIAKLAQLIPVIGAAVGLVVNYRLMDKLGTTAKNAYRMRILSTQSSEVVPYV